MTTQSEPLPAFIEWDRAVDLGDEVSFYGWIPRSDGRRDFVVVWFQKGTGEANSVITSSAKHSERLARMFVGDEGGHCPCLTLEEGLAALGVRPRWEEVPS